MRRDELKLSGTTTNTGRITTARITSKVQAASVLKVVPVSSLLFFAEDSAPFAEQFVPLSEIMFHLTEERKQVK